jgi:hypothetical protein
MVNEQPSKMQMAGLFSKQWSTVFMRTRSLESSTESLRPETYRTDTGWVRGDLQYNRRYVPATIDTANNWK